MRRLVRTELLAVLFIVQAAPARAHTVGLSRGEYRVAGSSVEVELSFARPELMSALPALDADHDRAISAAELDGAERLLGDTFVHGLEIQPAAGSCAGALKGANLAEADGLTIRAAYACDRILENLSVRLGFLGSLSLGHRHLATFAVGGADGARAVVYESRPEFTINSRSAASGGLLAGAGAWPLFRLGIEHILTGYDHLIFLLGLILVGGRIGPLLVVVTAFTLAHSLTLGLAALGVWAPSPRFVEPAIALSIAYVGIENWFVRDAARRWMITFPFGLIHGFGFAGALQEISLPSSQVPVALAAFNVGVEAGQVAVLAAVLPAILWLSRRRWFADRGVKAASTAIAVAGLLWFVSRVV